MLKKAVGPGIGIKTNNSRIKGLVDYINWLPTLSGGCFRYAISEILRHHVKDIFALTLFFKGVVVSTGSFLRAMETGLKILLCQV
jgi:hypothetical protein